MWRVCFCVVFSMWCEGVMVLSVCVGVVCVFCVFVECVCAGVMCEYECVV